MTSELGRIIEERAYVYLDAVVFAIPVPIGVNLRDEEDPWMERLLSKIHGAQRTNDLHIPWDRPTGTSTRKSRRTHGVTILGERMLAVELKQATPHAVRLFDDLDATVHFMEATLDIPVPGPPNSPAARSLTAKLVGAVDDPHVVRTGQTQAGNVGTYLNGGEIFWSREDKLAPFIGDDPEDAGEDRSGRPAGVTVVAYADKSCRHAEWHGSGVAHIEIRVKGQSDVERIFGVSTANELADILDAGDLPRLLLQAFNFSTVKVEKLMRTLHPNDSAEARRRRILHVARHVDPTPEYHDAASPYHRRPGRELSPPGLRLLIKSKQRLHPTRLRPHRYLDSIEIAAWKISTRMPERATGPIAGRARPQATTPQETPASAFVGSVQCTATGQASPNVLHSGDTRVLLASGADLYLPCMVP